jgi:purine nucleosidase
MTIADRRPRPAHEPTVDVAMEVDHQRFVKDFLNAVLWWAKSNH